MKNKLHKRSYDLALESNEDKRFRGYAIRFNSESEVLGSFTEVVLPGAIKNLHSDIRMLFNHDSSFVLGRTSSGTLELDQRSDGLYIVNDPPETQWARDLAVSVSRGDITQMSFGFRILKNRWIERTGKPRLHVLEEVEIDEVSIVTFPAYTSTSVDFRSEEAAAYIRSLQEIATDINTTEIDSGDDIAEQAHSEDSLIETPTMDAGRQRSLKRIQIEVLR